MSINFVAVSTQTANWDPGSICSFGWAEVVDGQIASEGQLLCRPPRESNWFSDAAMAVSGIKPSDVVNEPSFEDAVPAILGSLVSRPLVSHNAELDVRGLLKAYTYSGLVWPPFSYGCSLAWSRRLLDIPSHRLPAVADLLGDTQPLRGRDASGVARATVAMTHAARVATIDGLLDATVTRLGRVEPGNWLPFTCFEPPIEQTYIPARNLTAHLGNPLAEQTVVFAGSLSCMSLQTASDCVVASGGFVEPSVTTTTSLVVLGDGFPGGSLNEFRLSKKAEKALQYRAGGQPLELWSEVDFVEALITADSIPVRALVDRDEETRSAVFPRPVFKKRSPETDDIEVSKAGSLSPCWRWFQQ